MSQLRILQVSPYYFPEVKFGGPPRKMLGLAQALSAQGCAVRALTFHSENRQAAHGVEVEGVSVQYLPWRGWGTRQFVRKAAALEQAIRESDIVHAFGLYNFLTPLAEAASARLGRPFILEPLGNYRPRARNILLKRLYHAIFTARMFNRAAAVVANSEAEKADLLGVLPATKLYTRANGLDLSLFRTKVGRHETRKGLGFAEETTVLLFVGRITPIKNLETLLLSYRDAAIPDARLLLVGPIAEVEYVSQIRKLITTLSLEDTVQIMGPLYDQALVQAYAAADIFVLPSHSESYGNAAAEAVAAGLPVVLTDTCGIAPLIEGVAGFAVPCTRSGISEGLRKMSIPRVRERYCGNRKELISRLSWSEPAKEQMAIYERVLARRAG